MTERLDPLAAGADIEAGYKRYLKTLLAPRDPVLATAFDRAVDETSLLTKGPLLELTPPYAAGASLRSLVGEGVLHPNFTEFAETIALDRPLYQHQETAVRKAVAGRNLVVSTGTGSGKTESFLLPILNALIAEKAAGTLGPGVRALLLYPMNALANDQLKRLRQLLAATPDITFGRYTGETKQRRIDAESGYRSMFPGAARLPNELLSREEMWESPPNILLTNYAMLEYLLLRPRDMELFDGKYARTWQFIALDEAHVYDGAQGSEVGLLLRRLRDRVAGDRPLQCIATSASLSGSTDDRQGIEATAFAQKLFDVPFEFVDGDPSRQDLVTATRMPRRPEPTWQLDDDKLLKLAEPDADLTWIGANAASGDTADALHAERRTADLKKYARGGPASMRDLAGHLWPDDDLAATKLEALVALGSKVTGADGNPVLSARYHLFVRATEGAFVSFTDAEPRVLLSRHEIDPVTGRAVFEFGTCQRCGAVHLAGEPHAEGGREYFRPAKRDSKVKWLVLTDSDAADLVDEDDATLDEDAGTDRGTGIRSLCSGCGRLDGGAGSCGLDCPGGPVLRVREHPGAQRIMSKCTECGARSRQVIRRLRTDTNAAPAVITTALYQNLPAAEDETAENVGGGRKLLMFSDSRQAAAFAAPYLAETYGRMLQRRYLAHVLSQPKYAGDELCPEDLAEGARKVAVDAEHFDERATRTALRRAVNPWVMAELMAMDQRMSLEGLGLMAVSLFRPRAAKIPPAFAKFGLTDEDFWGLLDELVKTIRLQGAMSLLPDVDIKDPIFEPRANRIWIRSRAADRDRRIISWLPGGKPGTTNNRILFLRKVFAAIGAPPDIAERALDACWTFLIDNKFLTQETDRIAGTLHQLDQEQLRIRPGAECDWFQCGACRRLTTHNIRDLCPQGNCDGRLTPFTLPAHSDQDTNHYRTTYRTMAMLPLSAAEHTAQWEATAAAEVQRDFVTGRVNVLSCSTTFELGVDVGELQSVMLRNMPPKTANYVQRAGRAGRRAASAALVVTYAKRSSHDLSKFQNPESMIAGRMRIPWIPIENDRIGRRHAHSIALAAYFRHCFDRTGEEWRTAGDFFTPTDGAQDSPAAQVRKFLSPVPESVRASLRAALPQRIQHEIGVDDDAWVDRLCAQLADAENDIRTDIATFEELIEQAVADRQLQLGHRLQKTLETINKRQLLGYLANKNVLPKYGFPVDTVELRTSHCEGTVGARLELSRDLGQAIYDYAPGNQVVAGGKLWTSRGLHKLPKRELETLQYRVCKACNHFECGHVLDGPAVCSNCQTEFEQTKRCVLPEFGFVADRKPDDVKSEPPKRSWFGASYVETIGESVELPPWHSDTGVEVLARSGTRARLAVIGEGAGSGFVLCGWCGWADPIGANRAKTKGHARPATGTACSGPLEVVSLAHRYETDVAEITFSAELAYTPEAEARWLSALYALLEGASEALEISRDDIDGTLSWSVDGRRSIVLFDTVPAGAGASKQIAAQLDLVLRAAAERVTQCDCGVETSCYGCLRSFRNERFHDKLTREGALAVFDGLGLVCAEDSAVDHWGFAPTEVSDVVRALIAELAKAGVPQPEIGIEEGRHYWPVELAWPSSKVVVVEGFDSDRDSGLRGDGYRVIPAEADDAARQVGALVMQ
ncbi:DEAD/DEAH box helicase [Nocardia sp. NPDC058658]|uniref:DEAD/DEAH box helicase n=1 Tax=Nocardia sp. NPDC058658 TaxID=3346580 RepID=UPI00364B22BD